jgi:helix-turn-helix protein
VSRSNLSEQITNPKQSRSEVYKKAEDNELVEEIHSIIKERPSYGYRRILALINSRRSKKVNHKRLYRIMKINHLLLKKKPPRPKKSSYRESRNAFKQYALVFRQFLYPVREWGQGACSLLHGHM